MKDIHNHLLYGIDDGSKTFEDSVRLLKQMEKMGVSDIVFTPHYIIGTRYNCNNEEKRKILETLRSHTNINLYLGNEIFLDNDIAEYIEKDLISTINNTKYLLVEFPLNKNLEYGIEMCSNLVKKGYIPIIAHPERYHYFLLKDLEYLISIGCILQGNITSLIGKYGKSAKYNLILLLKKHMIYLMGTDTHTTLSDLESCYNILKKITTKDMYDNLLFNNFDKVINNEKIDRYDIVKTGNFFFKEKIK